MDKETLSNYGWIVICVLVLAVMIALAGPFGNFVADAVKSTTTGLFDTNKEALDIAGIVIGDQEFENTNLGTENIPQQSDPEQNPNNVAVQNGTYTFGDYTYTVISPSGNEFGASTIEEGREIAKAQYMQDMNMTWEEILSYLQLNGITEEQAWESLGLTENTFVPYTYEGWTVRVNDKTLQTYGPILNSINNKPILNVDSTFAECESMITAPQIPSTVNSMSRTFYGCKSLRSAPKIPTTVTNMGSTFAYCESLVDVSDMVIPSGVQHLSHTFDECAKLEKAPVIPNGITSLQYAFYGCESLVKAPAIPDSVTDMEYTFAWCTSLKEIPNLPSNITKLNWTFYHCTSLEVAPTLPQKLEVLGATFRGCSSLKTYAGAPVGTQAGDFSGYKIPNTVTSVTGTFYGCTSLVNAPVIHNGVTLMRETFNNCTSLTTAPTIPSSVTDLYQAFQNCTSLTGIITINGTPTGNLTGQCFKGVDFETQNISLTGTSSRLDDIGATGTNYCIECNGACNGGH